MKKVTVILSMFVFATSASSFAQKVVLQDIHNPKASSKTAVPNAPAQQTPGTKPAAKPAPVLAPKPTPTTLPAVQKVRETANKRK